MTETPAHYHCACPRCCPTQYGGQVPATAAVALTPLSSWQVMACPVCKGSGHVPAGFYGAAGATDLNAEECRACLGRMLLRVSPTGTVEPVP